MQEKSRNILAKPPSVENDPFKSQKWDELTAGRAFSTCDVPALSMLCQWYKLAQQAMDELDSFGGNTAYTNDMGDIKSFPQIATLKQCSTEIRQLHKQLGITERPGTVQPLKRRKNGLAAAQRKNLMVVNG